MVNQKPILIAGPPRSGTTMLAGLLHLHNIWVGRSRTTKYPGTNSNFGSENIDIKNIMKRLAKEIGYMNWKVPIISWNGTIRERNNIKQQIEQFIPDNEQWLVKTSWTLVFSDLWKSMYPEAYWIFPYRNPELILDSMNRHPGMSKRSNEQKKRFIYALQAIQKILIEEVNGISIDVYKISQRDDEELDKLFSFITTQSKEKEINDWLQPNLMRT